MLLTCWGTDGLFKKEYSLIPIPGPNSSTACSFSMTCTCMAFGILRECEDLEKRIQEGEQYYKFTASTNKEATNVC